jgi:TRAP-type transport system small permease protein
MSRVIELFERMTRGLHYVSGALIVALMLMTAANIIVRAVGGTLIPGTVELTEIAMVAIVFLGLAYAQVREDHIRVDLLYDRMRGRVRAVVGVFAALVSFVTVLVLTWRLFDYVGVLEASGRTTSSLSIPLFYVGYVAVAGSAIYALGVIVTAARRATVPEADIDRGTELGEQRPETSPGPPADER